MGVTVWKRFDTHFLRRPNDQTVRVHQEDMCQRSGSCRRISIKMGVGPGIKEIGELLRTHSSVRDEDVKTFVHGVGIQQARRTAPVRMRKTTRCSSTAAACVPCAALRYRQRAALRPTVRSSKARTSGKIGGKYRLRDIALRQWQQVVREFRVGADELTTTRQPCARWPYNYRTSRTPSCSSSQGRAGSSDHRSPGTEG